MPIQLPSNMTEEMEKAYSGEGGTKRSAPAGVHPKAYIIEQQYHIAGDGNSARFDYLSIVWLTPKGAADQFVSLAPKALWKFALLLQATNLTISEPAQIYTTALVGRQAEIRVSNSETPKRDGNGMWVNANVDEVYANGAYKDQQPIDISLKANEYAGNPTGASNDDLPF